VQGEAHGSAPGTATQACYHHDLQGEESTVKITQARLRNAHDAYVNPWLRDKWGHTSNWRRKFAEMILWYAVAGSRRYVRAGRDLNKTADRYVGLVLTGKFRSVPRSVRTTWRDALKLAVEVCVDRGTNPIEWFTGGCGDLTAGWERLDEVFGIGPKIASFILRDLSFLRDYLTAHGRAVPGLRQARERRWFSGLVPADQALFLPIDYWVYAGARQSRASTMCARYGDVNEIQASPELHRTAATEIVRWARKHGLDPRDVDVYWYGVGVGDLREDGTPAE